MLPPMEIEFATGICNWNATGMQLHRRICNWKNTHSGSPCENGPVPLQQNCSLMRALHCAGTGSKDMCAQCRVHPLRRRLMTMHGNVPSKNDQPDHHGYNATSLSEYEWTQLVLLLFARRQVTSTLHEVRDKTNTFKSYKRPTWQAIVLNYIKTYRQFPLRCRPCLKMAGPRCPNKRWPWPGPAMNVARSHQR